MLVHSDTIDRASSKVNVKQHKRKMSLEWSIWRQVGLC